MPRQTDGLSWQKWRNVLRHNGLGSTAPSPYILQDTRYCPLISRLQAAKRLLSKEQGSAHGAIQESSLRFYRADLIAAFHKAATAARHEACYVTCLLSKHGWHIK